MADTGYPNLITIDPATGAIGADFTGHVHAEGLDLDAGTSFTPPSDNRLRWLDPVNPAVAVVEEFAAESGIQGLFQFEHLWRDRSNTNQFLSLDTGGAGGRGFSVIAGPESRTLLTDAGASDFLTQLISSTETAIDVDTDTLTWPGGSPFSALLTVAHGLGRVPKVVLHAAGVTPLFMPVVCGFGTFTNVNFAVVARTADGSSPAAGTTVQFWWGAIG